ncbi:MAG: hypothetical protein RLZ25_1454 [Pseudomonadota bacterium]
MRTSLIVSLWLLYLAFAGYLLTQKTVITSDLTFFLPKATQPHEKLLLTASREGPGSRMLLVEVTGGSQKERFMTTDALVLKLRASDRFSRVQSGIDPQDLLHLEERLFPYRFVLSPSSPSQWEATTLHHALELRAVALFSVAGRLEERWLGRDPLGSWKQYLDQLTSASMPTLVGGHWVDASQNKALILIETRSAGFDIQAQEEAQRFVYSSFDDIPHADLKLNLGGAGLLAVETNRSITREATWLSIANTMMVSALLLLVYRSWRILSLSLIPLLTGLITGALAIRLHNGAIHAITLGFGSTLLGVAADYPNHFFTHLNPATSSRTTMQRLWPTLGLGILTNIAGFGVMFFSGFSGLQEIGIFASAGLLGAGLATRFILPQLSPASHVLGNWITSLSKNPIQKIAHRVRLQFCILIPISLGLIFHLTGRPLFNDDLATLNPVEPSRLASDINLQRAFRVPDMRWVIVVTGATEDEALSHCEKLNPVLRELLATHAISGYELVSDVLPSQETQKRRKAAIPTPQAAMAVLAKALKGTPFKTDAFAPLFQDLSAHVSLPPLSHDTFKGTILEPRLDAQIYNSSEGTSILVPIEGIEKVDAIETALASLGDSQIQLLDLRSAMTERIHENRIDASHLLIAGLLVIFGILAIGLHSLFSAFQVMTPMLLATLSTGLLLAMLANGLNIYHLASMLLVMGLSLDQSLFFNRPSANNEERARTHLSILVCSLSSILAFGGLAFASVPLLVAMGTTVSIGAFLAVSFAALLAK